jgi:hypothetical protein
VTATRVSDLTLPRVTGALALVLILAIAVPFAAFSRLHERRIAAADRQAHALAGVVGPLLTRQSVSTTGVMLLSGSGNQPRTDDDRWTESMPLAKAAGTAIAEPDPWGNSLLVIVMPAGGNRAAWVLSAGPDGIIQTPFPSITLTPAGDDRVAPVR